MSFLPYVREAAVLHCISYHYLQYLHIQQSSVSRAATFTSLLVLCSFPLKAKAGMVHSISG